MQHTAVSRTADRPPHSVIGIMAITLGAIVATLGISAGPSLASNGPSLPYTGPDKFVSTSDSN